MAEAYTNGTWKVKTGEEEAFVRDWTAFVEWGKGMPGAGTFRLVRDTDDPTHFMSFANWESHEAQAAWKATPEFKEGMARVRSHCDDFRPLVFELVTQVG